MALYYQFRILFKKGEFPSDTHAKITFFDGQELDFDTEEEKEMVFEFQFESGENRKDAIKIGNRAFKRIWEDKKVKWRREIPYDQPERTWLDVRLQDDLPLFGAIHAITDEFGNVKGLYLPQAMTITPEESFIPTDGTASIRVNLSANPFTFNGSVDSLVETKFSFLYHVELMKGTGNVSFYDKVWLPENLRIGEDRSRKADFDKAFSMIINTSKLSKALKKAGWKCEVIPHSPRYVEVVCKGEDIPFSEMYEYRDRKMTRIEGEGLPSQALAVSPIDGETGEMHILGAATGLFVVIADPVAGEDYSTDESKEIEFLKRPARERYLKIMRYVTHAAVRLEDGGLIP